MDFINVLTLSYGRWEKNLPPIPHRLKKYYQAGCWVIHEQFFHFTRIGGRKFILSHKTGYGVAAFRTKKDAIRCCDMFHQLTPINFESIVYAALAIRKPHELYEFGRVIAPFIEENNGDKNY